MISSLGDHLIEIDRIIESNKRINKKKFDINHYNRSNVFDHRDFFLEVIGKPVKEYENYNMYHCPLPDHEDTNPSFKVTINGYSCYGCGKWGNYRQFYKDYFYWNDDIS